MRHAPRALMGGLLTAASLSLAACGSSSGLLTSQQASSLTAALNQVESELSQRHCGAAEAQASALKGRISQLPSSVSPTVRSALEQGMTKVESLLVRDCSAPPAPTTPTTHTAPTTPTTPTAPTTPTGPATTTTSPGTTTGPPRGPGKGHGPPGHQGKGQPGKGKGGGGGTNGGNSAAGSK